MTSALARKKILLVGGSGGLGSATARWLVEEGAEVVITYCRNAERAGQLAGLGEIVQADVTLAEDRARLLGRFPDLYGLVVFAGIPARVSDPDQFETALRESLEVNFLGPILLARETAEHMRARGTEGSIVLISTMQAVAVFAGSMAYAAPKAALIHAARILAKEYRGSPQVRVNVVCPGVNRAGMAEESIAAGKYERYLRENMIPRYGQANDVARAVRFLLEPDNYVTGQVLVVDGGLTL